MKGDVGAANMSAAVGHGRGLFVRHRMGRLILVWRCPPKDAAKLIVDTSTSSMIHVP